MSTILYAIAGLLVLAVTLVAVAMYQLSRVGREIDEDRGNR